MAILKLSQKLEAFESSYDSAASGLKSKKSEVTFSLGNVATKLDDVISKVSQAANDSQSSDLTSCIGLAKDGLNQTKDCVNQILDGFFADCDSVITLIEAIRALIIKGNDKETELNSITINEDDTDAEKSRKEAEITRLKAEIKKINEEIEFYNGEGEKKIDAIQEAMSAVSFGVVGNMKKGGSLGPKSLYECNYTIKEYVSTETKEKTEDKTENGTENGTKNGTETGDGQNDTIVRNSFKDANEFEQLNLGAHKGQSDVISIPRNMREMKDAIKNGQPFILEKGSIFQYDPGGAGFNYYDATNGRKYFVQFEDGCYREVDENGNLVNNKSQKIAPSRIQEAGDNSTQTGWGFWWTNDTGFKYSGEQRETTLPDSTGTEKIDISKAQKGDSYVGTRANGTKIHHGESTVMADPKSMVELKEAVANGQPIRLSGVYFSYDEGQAWWNNIYDAKDKPIYLVKCEDGYYRSVDSNGNYVNDCPIDPERIAAAGDSTKPNWWANAPWHWGQNDTSFERYE